ncbi:MAG: glutamine--fructose-6-phosphate transaminase (isomerizing) [Myxococcota bacterium]|jgi:glucosamine--fructose-6-phosphate aminotransferase (isomerizing)|nr:glutamine--fructose-6-phosphate transaminase (isomerizing) [Myxococcota bacterium]
MCGIIGYVGAEPCTQLLLDGLSKLEYRGYDSAGIAVVSGGELHTRRAEGKLRNLVSALATDPVDGTPGIGHTRWATHGGPTEQNAHPHRVGTVAVVHNGIIENHLAIKRELIAAGHTFESETDTEIVSHLVWQNREAGMGLEEAVRAAVRRLEGAYSIVVIDASEPERIVAARLSSPLVLGLGEGANYVASDIPAILEHTRRMVFLEDGVMAVVEADSVRVRDITSGDEVPFEERLITWSPAMAEKGGYKHFMLKEIHEQPDAVANTLRGRISQERLAVDLPELGLDAAFLQNLSHFYIVACGTSWHAGLVGRYLLEDLAGLAPHVELASELRYRRAPMDDRTLVLAISQSGETADTLAALKDAKAQGARIVCVCNVIEASIPRLCDGTLYTHAGPEISVASTKAFSTQVAALHMLALHLGRLLGRLDDPTMAAELDALVRVAGHMERQLQDLSIYEAIARSWHEARSTLYLGRGALFPLALEGALKLKEISYIHAEGYAAGEMKHGPIALIDEMVPTVVLAPRDAHHEKVRSNLQEVKARRGPILAVHTEGDEETAALADFAIPIPDAPPHVLPLVCAIPMQLIAYVMAEYIGTDVDQPRNLAKSVTVE